ncbi:MAG: hypothetical protein SFW09_17235 [Hyphomicrobiaceae bacterium]|nr:hypothetical protein [Hyphomicrobiaceae bacterium]
MPLPAEGFPEVIEPLPHYEGQLHGLVAGSIYGHVLDSTDKRRVVQVEVRLNGFTSAPYRAERPPLGSAPSKVKGHDRSFYIPVETAWLSNSGEGSQQFELFDAETGHRIELPGPDRFDWHPLCGHIDKVTTKEIIGWAINCEQPQLPVRVMALVGGEEVARGISLTLRPDLREIGDRTGACGFKLSVTNARVLIPGAELRLVDEQSGRVVHPGAMTVPLPDTPAEAPAFELLHGITSVHGLTIEGWVADPTGARPPPIEVVVNGVPRMQVVPSIPSARAFLSGGDINGGFQIWLPRACADALTPLLPKLTVALKAASDGRVLWEGSLLGSAIRLEYIRSLTAFSETTSVHPLSSTLGQSDVESGAKALSDLWKDAAARQKQAGPLLPAMMLALIDRLIAAGQVEAAIDALVNAPQTALLAERARYVRTVLALANAATPEQAMSTLLRIAKPLDKSIRSQNFFFKAASLALRARAGTCMSLVREALILLGSVKFGDSATSAIRDVVSCFASPDQVSTFNYLVTCEIVGHVSHRSANG